MSCEVCGYAYCHSSHSCPECARRRTPVNPMGKEHVEAGHQFGAAIVTFIAALFIHPYFCFVGFWLIGFGLLLAVVPGISIGETNLAALLPDWYPWLAAAIPLVLAFLLRKIVRRLMMGGFIVGCVALVAYFILGVVELRRERAAPATAAPAATAPAPRQTGPRAPTAAEIQATLIEAATPEVTVTAPGSDPPGEMFEGVDLRICEMSLGGVDVCQRYCATLEVVARPGWCR